MTEQQKFEILAELGRLYDSAHMTKRLIADAKLDVPFEGYSELLTLITKLETFVKESN